MIKESVILFEKEFTMEVIRDHRDLKVYQKVGMKCTTCNQTIIKIKVSSRGTYFCPTCQRKI